MELAIKPYLLEEILTLLWTSTKDYQDLINLTDTFTKNNREFVYKRTSSQIDQISMDSAKLTLLMGYERNFRQRTGFASCERLYL